MPAGIIGASPIVTNKKVGTACGLQFSVPAECFSLKFLAVQCYQIPVIFLNYFELYLAYDCDFIKILNKKIKYTKNIYTC